MIIGGALELSEHPHSFCAADPQGRRKICSQPAAVKILQKFLRVHDDAVPSAAPKIVKRAKEILGVQHEYEIFENPAVREFIGGGRADMILRTDFIPRGPSTGTALLDNFNIDEVLAQWAASKEFKKLLHIPFQMIDFAERGTELAVFMPNEMTHNAFACVLNTDTSSGRGKHWFALYGERAAGTEADPVVIEYFNSSGYPPKLELLGWLENVVLRMRKAGAHARWINVCNGFQLQYSRTECGVWSLVYILARLLGKPRTWIVDTAPNDTDMIEYRQRLFRPK